MSVASSPLPEAFVLIVHEFFCPVRWQSADNTHIIVTEGLKKGEEVVSGSYTAITSQLKEGSLVKNKHDF